MEQVGLIRKVDKNKVEVEVRRISGVQEDKNL